MQHEAFSLVQKGSKSPVVLWMKSVWFCFHSNELALGRAHPSEKQDNGPEGLRDHTSLLMSVSP